MHSIGIDMSKDTFHAAFDESTVRQFENDEAGIDAFLGWLRERGCVPPETEVGVEATGVYHLLFAASLGRNGWTCRVINPLVTSRLIRSTLRRVKNDRKDAIAIRKAVMLGEGYSFIETPDIQKLKALVQERDSLCRMRAQCKQWQHVHDVRTRAMGGRAAGGFKPVIALLKREISEKAKTMARIEPDAQRLLRTIPGIGAVSAAALVASVGDIRRFSSPEKLVAYIGLDCRVYESGASVKGKGYMTKRGNKYLRHILFNAAFIAQRRNPDLHAYFEKKKSEGKHYFSALCAVERKLVHLVHAVWTRGTPFEQR